MASIFLWSLNENVEIRSEINESVVKISNIQNHLYLLTEKNTLYHGTVQNEADSLPFIELEKYDTLKLIDIDSYKEFLYVVSLEGNVFKCNNNVEILNEITLVEDCLCTKGHTGTKCKMKVSRIAVNEYGQLFITEFGHLWASGNMPQIKINSDFPRRVNYFVGRNIHSINVGNDFAIAIVSKPKDGDLDSDDEDVFLTNCPQCLALSASQLASPVSQASLSDTCPLGVKVQGSYDIETTSTSSKISNSSGETKSCSEKNGEIKTEKNIIFRNTEAAKDFLSKQISRMSSVGEEYLVECTEKPTRLIKENVSNVASLVYEGVKTVGDKVVTLSRHVSGSSDNNSVLENIETQVPRSNSKDDFMWSLSQCTSEKELSEQDIENNVHYLAKKGCALLNSEVWTWGNIIHGQLGIGDKIKRERPMIITKLSNIGVQKVSVQKYHASAITLDGRGYIWGKNDHHQVSSDTTSDQSSPRLYITTNEHRIKDVVCGTNFTVLLENNGNVKYQGKSSQNGIDLFFSTQKQDPGTEVKLFNNLVASDCYTVLNLTQTIDAHLSKFIVEEQQFLEDMLVIHVNLIKPLLKKNITSSSANLFEDLCKNYVDLLYLVALNIKSLLDYSNTPISICDITLISSMEEFIYVCKNYLSILYDLVTDDSLSQISKLMEIPQGLYKLKHDLVVAKKDKNCDNQLVLSLLSDVENRFIEYSNILEHFKLDPVCVRRFNVFWDDCTHKKQEAELTREFWMSSGKLLDFLKLPSRKLIRDSHKYPINLQNSSRFTSHWFILFNDIFVHLNGSTPHIHHLTTIWLEPQQDETTQQYQISLKTPEDTIILNTLEPEVKIEWFHVMQSAIKAALKKEGALQPPLIRSGSYLFTKNGFLKDATYCGRWSNAKMQGKGVLKWPDGKRYTGQFNNNLLCGTGIMEIPNVGVYEGQWKDNQQNGYGILNYYNSDVYKGHFKDGHAHGHGLLQRGTVMAKADSFYIGDWIQGVKCGYGILDDVLNGEKYIGNWSDNKRHGNGLIITTDGIYYEGVFNQDVLTGQGLMILGDGTRYEGEFKGTGIISGKGTLTLPTGHVLEGTLNGSISEGIKISNGTLLVREKQSRKSFDSNCTSINHKWRALFKHCYQLLGIPEANNLNRNGVVGKQLDTQKIWQNVAVSLSNAATLKYLSKNGNEVERRGQNGLNNLDIIPPFGKETLDLRTYSEVKQYLIKAFETTSHPLGSLLINLSEAYTATYGGKMHPLLLKHAISELHYISKRLYDIVRCLFPALPIYDQDFIIDEDLNEEVINYRSLLYPIILPKVYQPLFKLFTLKNELGDKLYKKTLLEWNNQSDFTLMTFLCVDKKFYKTEDNIHNATAKNILFVEAVDTLQQLKNLFSPTEKLFVIRQTVQKMTPVARNLLGSNYSWNMDDLFPIFLYIVVRARIPDLGSELDFMDNFIDPSLESGELGIIFTTLKACYQQILQEKSSL